MSLFQKIKQIILSHKFLYEAFFFLSGKKLNRRKIDKQIEKFVFDVNRDVIKNLIVSLTSYGKRVSELKYTLFSLVNQTVRPEKIIVWLSCTEFSRDKLSNELLAFENYGVEFEFCEDLKSYKKLIPALEQYPDYYIVTADDDIFYNKKWLELLWEKHLQYPNYIIAHIVHQITFSRNKLLPYKMWVDCIQKDCKGMFPTGCGGILYHKKMLFSDVDNSKLFMSLSPKADDIWFYFMSLLCGTMIKLPENPILKLKCVDVYKEYGLNGNSSLQHENVEQNLNDVQIRNIMNHYNISDEDLYKMIYKS
ncbi:MAG: glycosyltransferase family A protein [Bacteroidales bacterium]|nr:glycosyltransferase family A protein [Bacteroidales bacterium]